MGLKGDLVEAWVVSAWRLSGLSIELGCLKSWVEKTEGAKKRKTKEQQRKTTKRKKPRNE